MSENKRTVERSMEGFRKGRIGRLITYQVEVEALAAGAP
jgi:hypothetical protein